MIDAVINGDLLEIERADALNASDIDTIFVGIGAPLVVGVNAAFGAEIVFRTLRSKLVKAQHVFASDEFDTIERG